MANTPPPTLSLMASSSSTNTPLSIFNYKISDKLDENNYLVWLQQIESVLFAHRLHRCCVAPAIPPQFLNEAGQASNIENPAYSAWELQDQLLLAWLQASQSSSILPSVIGWRLTFPIDNESPGKTVEHSSAHNKGNSTISEFLAKIKHSSDSLLSIGESGSLQDQLDVILEGLPTEFKSLVTLINSKMDWFDLEEIKRSFLLKNSVWKNKLLRRLLR